MFCPKCGTENNDNMGICEGCGYVYIKPEEKADNEEVAIETEKEGKPLIQITGNTDLIKKNAPAFAMWIIAAIVFIISFVAAGNIASGGAEISSIQSVGGQTLEEAYYQSLGSVYAGYAGIVRAIGIFMTSVLTYLGARCFKK